VGYSGACVTDLQLHGMISDTPRKPETREYERYAGKSIDSMIYIPRDYEPHDVLSVLYPKQDASKNKTKNEDKS